MDSKHAAHWWPIYTVVALAVAGLVATLKTTGRLIPTWEWLHHVSPEGWSASAAWFAVLVGVATVLVGGRYAKQQVAKAQEQVSEAQAARKAQAEQSQAALETQVGLAEEQAQPVVVMYTELHPEELQFIEIVVKNFGLTPAYDVKIAIDPEIKASPNLVSEGRLAEVSIPRFPILAPNQEWRTGWDHYPSRLDYVKKFERLSKPDAELNGNEKLDIQFLRSQNAYPMERLPSRHDVVITFSDSSGKVHTTRASLDSDLYRGTSRFDVKSMHDLVQLLDKQLPRHNATLADISSQLHDFSTEHKGLWVYGSNDDEERLFRRAVAAATTEDQNSRSAYIRYQLTGHKEGRPLPAIDVSEATQILIDEAKVGDWFVPVDDAGSLIVQRAWRITFIKKVEHPQIGLVFELYNPFGNFIYYPGGVQINIARNMT